MASSRQPDDGTAPTYTIPRRSLGALEHPLIIKNLDKGIKTFGQNNAFQAVSPSFPSSKTAESSLTERPSDPGLCQSSDLSPPVSAIRQPDREAADIAQCSDP